MSSFASRILGVTLTLTGVAPAPSLAQVSATAPRQVPIEIVTGVTAPFAGFTGRLDFVIGHAPARWPVELLPHAPAEVIGGAVSPALVLLTVRYPQGAAAALERYGAILAKAGWRQPVRPSQKGGFQPTERLAGLGTFCRERDYLTVTLDDSSATRSVINVMLPIGDQRMYSLLCDTTDHTLRVDIGPRASNGASVPMPKVTAPAGVEQLQGSTSISSAGELTSSARVKTGMPVRALATHYLDQLASMGWTRATPSGTDDWAGAAVEKGEGADRWRIVMLITNEGDWRDLTMRLRRSPARGN